MTRTPPKTPRKPRKNTAPPVPRKGWCVRCDGPRPLHPGRDVCTPCAVLFRVFAQL